MTIKVLCVSKDADRATEAMLIGVHRAGVDLAVACPKSSRTYTVLIEAGVRVIDIEIHYHFDLIGIRLLRRELLRGSYDIIHVFNNKALQNGLLATWGIPTRIIAYRGIVGNVSFFDPISWMRFLNPRIDRITCVADAVRDYFLQMRPKFLRIPMERLVTIYKGHSLEWYTDPPADLTKFGVPLDAFVICCVANIRPRKGIELLVDAMAELPGEWQVHLLLVGHMNTQSLGKRISASAVKKRIHRIGYSNDAPALAGACNIFVLPSIKREGLARALIEAMAYGIPPIVTNCGGNPELVVDGISGLVIPVCDAKAISQAIGQMYKNPGMRREMGRAARERIKKHFNIEDTIKQTTDLYQLLAPK
ncbi:MAG: glycosyltransferase family 4 protein [Gammaproteobacteria bacterium]